MLNKTSGKKGSKPSAPQSAKLTDAIIKPNRTKHRWYL